VVHQIAFSPDGSLLLTTDPDGHRAQLWDAGTGNEILAYAGHNNFLFAAAFVPNPLRVVTTIVNAFWVWDLPPRCQSLIDAARAELRRGLTDEERSRYFLEHDATPDANWLVTTARRLFAFALPGTKAACA
jgi:WD40 repeat protein